MSMRRWASPCPMHAHYLCRVGHFGKSASRTSQSTPAWTRNSTARCPAARTRRPQAARAILTLGFLRNRLRDSGNPLVSTTADLYWVSAPMTALARHAATRLPARTLHAHDLPSQIGFMVFEAPLATYVNNEGREVQIVAVSWSLWGGPGGRRDKPRR